MYNTEVGWRDRLEDILESIDCEGYCGRVAPQIKALPTLKFR